MKKLFLFGEDSRHPQEIEFNEEISAQDILAKHQARQGPAPSADEYHLFREDEAHPLAPGKDHHAFKDKEKIHCHRCRHIDVRITYNGQHAETSVPPAATGARLLAQIPKLFKGVSPKDAANLRLQAAKDVFIDKDDHIGSFVKYPHCHLEIDLVSKTNIQG